MVEDKKSYVYGPVPSRRLGVSLGVDLVPYKTCDYDCIYCQLGRTNNKTAVRSPYNPADAILEQLKERLDAIPSPDYITISGSGEPTLNTELREVVEGIRGISDVPIAVLTNGSLLGDLDVAAACLQTDLVVPSLDAGDEETFQVIDRPSSGLRLEDIVDGITSFRKDYKGKIWLEIMVLEGVNSSEEHMEKLKSQIERIGPDRVQLNTVTRPPAESFARPVTGERLERIRSLLGEGAEIIEAVSGKHAAGGRSVSEDDILSLLSRRPCTVEDVSRALGIHENEVTKAIGELAERNEIAYESIEGRIYYRPR